MKRLYLLLLVLLNLCMIYAQDIEVKKFEPLEKDQTAVMSPRKDINGTTCGLVKVALKEAGAEFEGNVMGDVEFTGKEYLVYLPNGTKRLGIKHPDYLPTTIVFADYGTKRVTSGTTYQLNVKTNKKKAKVDNSKKGMAVFNIKPSNAMLIIDGQIADGSGGAYTLSLPYGTHYYTVKLKDFSLNNQAVHVDKNAKTVNVDLTEYYAQVKVSCLTQNADIYINGNLKGENSVTEMVAPGKCTIEVRKEGFYSLSKTIELGDNDVSIVAFENLNAITGKLQVKTNVIGCRVYLNGEMAGTTPMTKNIPIGDYTLEIKHDYYRTFKRTITIGEDQYFAVDEKLVQTQFGKIAMSANQGNDYGMCLLTSLYLYGSKNALKEEYWGNDNWGTFSSESPGDENVYFVNRDLFIQEDIKIEKDIEKAYYWYEKRKALPEEKKDYYTWWCWDHFAEELYTCYLTGDGVKQKYEIAFSLLGDLSDYSFSFWKAWHYFYGKGVSKDTFKALEYLNTLRSYVSSESVPYQVCNLALFVKLAKSAAVYYNWDGRLLKFFDGQNF